jgi:hypothetical protein
LPLGLFLAARANLHLAQGRSTAALKDARAAGEMMSATISNPACCGWRSSAALALAALDRAAQARAIVEDELADARRFAIPDAEGAALRTLGLVAGGAEGVEALSASVAALEPAEGRLECARSLLELGAALRTRASAPRRGMSCARRSTRRRARERADWRIAPTRSWSPQGLARAETGECCRGGSR